MAFENITKETLNSIKEQQQLNKAFTTSTGLVGYNLEAPAKQLVPFLSPLRNRIPRKVAKTGTSTHWKAITAVDAGGKLSTIEGTRGNSMSYTVADKVAIYKTIGLQDSITFEAQAAGRNFQDILATSTTNLLQRVMCDEEKMILGGNITSLGTPDAPTLATSTTGGSIAADTYYCKVAALTLAAANRVSLNSQSASMVLGVSATDSSNATISGAFDGVTTASDNANVTTTGSASTITLTATPVTGALAYAWFVSTTSGSETLQIVTTNSAVTLTEIVSGGSSAPTADGSGDPLAFDGIIPQIINGGGYYLDMANDTLTKANGGIEQLDVINSYLFNNYKISPTRILASEQVAKDITSGIIAGAGTPTLFVNNAQKNDITGNYMVKRYVNKSYGGQEIIIETHPWLPNGTMVVMSENVPYPNANVPSVMEIECGYDYMQIEYARTNPKYEYEVRSYEALKHYFPSAQAIVTNIASGIA